MIAIIPHVFDPEHNYYDAINSGKWVTVRERVIERDGGKCRFCGCTDPLQVHHIRYCNDRGETDYFDTKNLVTLCAPCHQIVSEAVKTAKEMKIEVPTFVAKPGMSFADQVANKIKHAAYTAEADLVADTLFKLWKRSLKGDSPGINMRNLSVMKPIGEIVMESIESQAGATAMGAGVAFAERTINRITEYLAKAYDHCSRDGMTDQEFMYTFKVNYVQLTRIKRNADRLHRTGVYYSTGSDASG